MKNSHFHLDCCITEAFDSNGVKMSFIDEGNGEAVVVN
jgi:hypothetical protein